MPARSRITALARRRRSAYRPQSARSAAAHEVRDSGRAGRVIIRPPPRVTEAMWFRQRIARLNAFAKGVNAAAENHQRSAAPSVPAPPRYFHQAYAGDAGIRSDQGAHVNVDRRGAGRPSGARWYRCRSGYLSDSAPVSHASAFFIGARFAECSHLARAASCGFVPAITMNST